MKVLVVEDDESIAEPLCEGLTREGFEAQRVATGREALGQDRYDVVLLDLRLPDMDGFEVCRQIRARSDVPIIMVTARGDEVDRVVGLEIGADDYIVKPFGFRELVARIRAVTRRHGRPSPVSPVLRAAGLELDPRARTAALDGRDLGLTPKEFDLLEMLMGQPGSAVTRREILGEIWDPHWYGPTKTLDVHIASLRRKLGNPAWIETVRGIGFRFKAVA
jgi:two-component system, OmpR family, response regulator RegX3